MTESAGSCPLPAGWLLACRPPAFRPILSSPRPGFCLLRKGYQVQTRGTPQETAGEIVGVGLAQMRRARPI